MTIKKLKIFDFDHTLVNTSFIQDIADFEQSTKKSWPADKNNFWETPESLTLLPSKLNENVAQKFREFKKDKNNLIIVMTGRGQQLRQEVKNILNKFELLPDLLFLRPIEQDILDYKKEMIRKFSKKFDGADIEMFEDRINHANEFERFGKELNISLVVNKVIQKELLEKYKEYRKHCGLKDEE